ncbi:MAG: hypothetical protein ABR552_05945, partial [Actinomycetota bacterium]
MSVIDPAAPAVIEDAAPPLRAVVPPRRSLLVPLFGLTLLLSSTLLFSVQPMFAKIVLPLLGSSPAVWITFMLFFQAVLLAGYAYAHVIAGTRYAAAHLLVLAFGIAFLPVAVPHGWSPPASGNPSLWLLALLAVAAGAPAFAVSATAPLLQRWFSLTRHRSAGDPYFLYAASNIGSMGSLLAYPIIVEPHLRLAQQARIWTIGYAALIVLIGACVAVVRRAPARPDEPHVCHGSPPASRARRLRWVALAFIPSSLMLG